MYKPFIQWSLVAEGLLINNIKKKINMAKVHDKL